MDLRTRSNVDRPRMRFASFHRFLPSLFAVLAGLVLGIGSGCKKGDAAGAGADGKYTLPGASDVLAALEKKDYPGAIGGLAEIKSRELSEADAAQYRRLQNKVKDTILESVGKDQAATDAMQALRILITGK